MSLATSELRILHKVIVATDPRRARAQVDKALFSWFKMSKWPKFSSAGVNCNRGDSPKGSCQGILDLWPHLFTQPFNSWCSWPLPIYSVDPHSHGALSFWERMPALRLWKPPGLGLWRPGRVRLKSTQVAKGTVIEHHPETGLMLFPVAAESARGIVLPAFNSLQNLSDRDKTLAASPLDKDSTLLANRFSHSPLSSQIPKIWQLFTISFFISIQGFEMRWGKQKFRWSNTNSRKLLVFALFQNLMSVLAHILLCPPWSSPAPGGQTPWGPGLRFTSVCPQNHRFTSITVTWIVFCLNGHTSIVKWYL